MQRFSSQHYYNKKERKRDFSDGPVVKNPPSIEGDMSLIPGQGTRIPHAVGHLSPHDSTRQKPAGCSGQSCVLKQRPAISKKTIKN